MISMKIEDISPETAKKYLELNFVNRSISENRVASYARDMRSDNWQLNGESLKFNTEGQLIDGQHRLYAIIRSGKTIPMCVVRGLAVTINEVDRGKSRTTRDTLTIEGYDKSIVQNFMVSAIRLLTSIMLDIPFSSMGGITDSEIRKAYSFYEKEIKQVISLNHYGGAGLTKKSAVTATLLMALKCGVSEETIQDFATVLNTGRYINNKQLPAMVLRDDFLQNKFRRYNKIRIYEQLYCIEKALYDFENGIMRKQTYSTCNTPIYSCSPMLKAEKEETNE